MSPPTFTTEISALILAGGQGQRLGGEDKGLLELNQQPLIEYVLQAIRPEVQHIMISANRNLDRYAQYGYPVYADSIAGFMGPLAGILSGLQHCPTDWLLILPADTTGIPQQLVARMWQAVHDQSCTVAIADDGNYLQPTYALLNISLRDNLQHYLENGGRKTQHWMQQQTFCQVDFSDQPEAFLNINTQSEFSRVQQALKDKASP